MAGQFLFPGYGDYGTDDRVSDTEMPVQAAVFGGDGDFCGGPFTGWGGDGLFDACYRTHSSGH